MFSTHSRFLIRCVPRFRGLTELTAPALRYRSLQKAYAVANFTMNDEQQTIHVRDERYI